MAFNNVSNWFHEVSRFTHRSCLSVGFVTSSSVFNQRFFAQFNSLPSFLHGFVWGPLISDHFQAGFSLSQATIRFRRRFRYFRRWNIPMICAGCKFGEFLFFPFYFVTEPPPNAAMAVKSLLWRIVWSARTREDSSTRDATTTPTTQDHKQIEKNDLLIDQGPIKPRLCILWSETKMQKMKEEFRKLALSHSISGEKHSLTFPWKKFCLNLYRYFAFWYMPDPSLTLSMICERK